MFYSTVLCVVAWIMKAVADFFLMNELFDGVLHPQFHTNTDFQRLENTISIIASNLEHSAGSSVTNKSRHTINKEKHLTRCFSMRSL